MKFNKEDAIQNLKAQFITKGKTLKLSDRTISDTLENLMTFATDETELDTFAASAFKTLDSMNGNHIKDTSDFVKTWNEAHPAVTPPTPPAPDGKPDALADMKKMMEDMLNPVIQKITGIETKTKTETLIQTAEGLFSAKKPDPKWKAVQDKAKQIVNAHIAPDTTAEVLAAEYDKEYNGLLSTFGGEGAYVPAESITGQGSDKAESAKHVEALRKAGLLPKVAAPA
jgi:hypothetical protein